MQEGSQLMVVLALVGAGLALLAAIACIGVTAWIVRRDRAGQPTSMSVHRAASTSGHNAAHALAPTQPYQQPTVVHVLQPQPVLVMQPHAVPIVHAGRVAPEPSGVRLQRAWPGVADALGQHLRIEADPVERMRVAIDLGGIGGARPARLLLDAVRDGTISPAAGAEAISRTGFDGGVLAGMALAEGDPRVRSLAQLVLDGTHAEPAR